MRALGAGIALLAATAMAPAEKVELVTHQSEVLGIEKQFNIYVPPTSEEGERFPVLYVLHGRFGSHTDWPDLAKAAEAAKNYRMILVFPDGSPFSWYLDSPTMPESQYQSYVAKELVDYVDAHYPTVTDRGARGIMGLSMGGHGAFTIAAKYPERFGSASSLSGILKLTNHPTREDVIERLGSMEEFPERWKEYSAWDQAEKFTTANVRLLIDCGEDDTKTGAIQDSRQMHERLRELGVPHIWREHAGTHSWEYWSTHLPEHLNFHQAAMIDHTSMGRWEAHYFKLLRDYLDENMRWQLGEPGAELRVALVGSSGIEGIGARMKREGKEGLRFFNRGIASDRLGIGARGISRRMEESVFDFDADVFLISNGMNDLAEQARSRNGTPTMERMTEEFAKILDAVGTRQPATRRIVVSLPPTTGRYAHLAPLAREFNARLAELCTERGIPFVDVYTPMANEEGELREEFSRDGLHFTPAGSEVWIEQVMPQLEALQAR